MEISKIQSSVNFEYKEWKSETIVVGDVNRNSVSTLKKIWWSIIAFCPL